MEIMDLLNLNLELSKRTTPVGISSNSREIPPFVQILLSYFELRSYQTTEQFIRTLIESQRNPQILESIKTEAFKMLPPHVQGAILTLLSTYFSSNDKNFLSAFKNVVVGTMLDKGINTPVSLSNINDINGADIGKVLAVSKGLDLSDRVFAEVSTSIRTYLPSIIDAVYRTYGGDANAYGGIIVALYQLLIMCDGFHDLVNVVKVLNSKALTISENIAEAMKKSSTGMELNISDKDNIKRASVSILSLKECIGIIDQILAIAFQEMVQFYGGDQGRASQSVAVLKELLLSQVPNGLLEDISLAINYSPVKTNSSEYRAIHLNAMFVATSLMTMNIPKHLSFVIAYIAISISYRNSPSVIDNKNDITPAINIIFQNIGLNQLNPGSVISGDITVKSCIKLDLLHSTNALTTIYASVNNDKAILAGATTLLANPIFNPRVVYEYICTTYAMIQKGNRYKNINLEFIEVYLTHKGYSQFTSANNPAFKPFLDSYVDAIVELVQMMEMGQL